MVASGFVTAKYADVAEYNGITWSHKDLYGGHKWAGSADSLCRYRRVHVASPHHIFVVSSSLLSLASLALRSRSNSQISNFPGLKFG